MKNKFLIIFLVLIIIIMPLASASSFTDWIKGRFGDEVIGADLERECIPGESCPGGVCAYSDVMNNPPVCITEGYIANLNYPGYAAFCMEPGTDCDLDVSDGSYEVTGVCSVIEGGTTGCVDLKQDGDISEADCAETWVGLGGQSNCCGDDIDEYVLREESCDLDTCTTTDLVFGCGTASNQCWRDNASYDSGYPYNMEKMYLYCDEGIWYDQDFKEGYCKGRKKWVDAACCGDDANEYPTKDDTGIYYCCENKGMIIDKEACFMPTVLSCTDSDNGKNYYVKGTITGQLVSPVLIYEDTCVGDGELREMFCNAEGKGEPYLHQCNFDCKEGACTVLIEEDIGIYPYTKKLSYEEMIATGEGLEVLEFSIPGNSLINGQSALYGGNDVLSSMLAIVFIYESSNSLNNELISLWAEYDGYELEILNGNILYFSSGHGGESSYSWVSNNTVIYIADELGTGIPPDEIALAYLELYPSTLDMYLDMDEWCDNDDTCELNEHETCSDCTFAGTWTCDHNGICDPAEPIGECDDCNFATGLSCNHNDICELNEPEKCGDCHFASGWSCNHNSVCETGEPERTCDDCLITWWNPFTWF